MAISLDQARHAKEAAKSVLADVPGVVGVGLTKIGDDYALKVNLREELPSGVSIPKQVAGVPVVVEVVGIIKKRG
jgi:ABC-type Fe3+ transport system substrate-binding protein